MRRRRNKQTQKEQTIDEVLSARTPEECEKAKKLIIAWMQEHPKDFGMLEAGEQITMIMHDNGWLRAGSARVTPHCLAGKRGR